MPTRAQYRMVAEDDPQWARFWNAYPKRVAKKDARKAWAELNPSPETVDRIVEALQWQQQSVSWQNDGGAFIPYPASYLRAERWTDEPIVPTRQQAMSQAVTDPMSAWLSRKAVGS